MSKIKQLLFVAVMLIECSVAVGQTATYSFPLPAFHWRCNSGNTTLNHNPAMLLENETIAFDSIPYSKDYTIIAVYKPISSKETMLWHMTYGDSSTRGMTTERILSDSISTRYAEQTDNEPAINTLRQSSPDSTMPYVRLCIGGTEEIIVAEVLYYTERLGNSTLRKIQSHLAVQYGITLGPTSYIESDGSHIWNYADSGRYHHRVTGIGVDTISGLRQLRSRSEMNESILTIATDSMMHGEFLMVGDNGEPSVFEQDGNMERLLRSWKIQSTKVEDKQFSLIIDTRNISKARDSLVLLVDDYVYFPDYLENDSLMFSGIRFPTDSSHFTLGRGGLFWQLADKSQGTNGGSKASGGEMKDLATSNDNIPYHFFSRMYPNPTFGHYNLEVNGAEKVQVTIYNVQGIVMTSFESEGQSRHHFEGDLPSGNVYYAIIRTDNGNQTMKLVVK